MILLNAIFSPYFETDYKFTQKLSVEHLNLLHGGLFQIKYLQLKNKKEKRKKKRKLQTKKLGYEYPMTSTQNE